MMHRKRILLSMLGLALAGGCTAKAQNNQPEKSYAVVAAVAPTPPQKDARGNWTVTITPKAPWVLKTTTPLTALLKASSGVKLDKSPLKADDIVDATTTAKSVRTGFVAGQNGQQTIGAELTFFLCTDEICQRHKDTVEVSFTVE